MNVSFKESFASEGIFQAYKVLGDHEELVYEDHNQIQFIGLRVLGRLMSLGSYGKDKPVFSSIKASAALDNDYKATPIRRSDNLLPAEHDFPERIVKSKDFEVVYPLNAQAFQYIEAHGIFSAAPGGVGLGEPGKYYHFGLYMSSFLDFDEYLFAYKFVEAGVSFPSDFSIKIAWRINLSSSL